MRLPDLKPLAAAVFRNPVVVRDLRAQMRGTKSYWYQGGYLLLLSLLAIAGYAVSTGQGPQFASYRPYAYGFDIVTAQHQLQLFYRFLFGTLAILICLIAPALTASSIVSERQRLSLDLLMTTPLSAGQILAGKLVSSLAFLVLLLVLSLPAASLCVVLGGATFADVLRVYCLLIVGGLFLASIGLYFSCACRTGLIALIWSYGATAAFVLTSMFAVIGSNSLTTGLGGLNPLVAVGLGSTSAATTFGAPIALGPVHLPLLLVTLVFAALLIRLLVTAAAYRLGFHGGGVAPSLRRQFLLFAGLFSFAVVQGMLGPYMNSAGRSSGVIVTGFLLLLAFLFVAFPLLPGLFVPAGPEDAPPGAAEASVFAEEADGGLYRMRRAFLPVHSGSLPYFHLVLLAVLGGGFAAARLWGGLYVPEALLTVTGVVAVMAGVGFLAWSIARFAAGIAPHGVSQARAIAFGILLLVLVVPVTIGYMKDMGESPTYQWSGAISPLAPLVLPMAFRFNMQPTTPRLTEFCLLGALNSLLWSLPFLILAAVRPARRRAAAPAVQ